MVKVKRKEAKLQSRKAQTKRNLHLLFLKISSVV